MFWKHLCDSRTLARTVAIVGLLRSVTPTAAAELEIVLPLGRTACQTNEWIDLSVVRLGTDSLDAGELRMNLGSDDGSRLEFAFCIPAAAKDDASTRRMEHYHLCGCLLRPGHCTVAVQADGRVLGLQQHPRDHATK